MEKDLDVFLKFCASHKSIICYGASDHGYTVKHYLESKDVKVIAFMISDDVAKGEYRDGIPVYSVKDVNIFGDDVGIVLSLYERHHDTVVATLHKNGRTTSIYPLSDKKQKLIRQKVLTFERKNILTRYDFNVDEKLILEQKARLFLKNYKKIECMFMDAFRIGTYAIWTYFCWKRKIYKNDTYLLYYPVTHQHHDEEKLKGPNGYLLGKLQGEGIACISENNISFWQYMYSFHGDAFVFKDDYHFANYTDKLIYDIRKIPVENNLIELSRKEEQDGRDSCYQMGIEKPYICISNRDVVFLHSLMRDKVESDFRDTYRNSHIENCYAVAEYLKSKDIQLVRMGSVVEKSWKYCNVIDYASSEYRSEFLDVYLTLHCKFFVSDVSGIMAFAMLMAKPMIAINASLLTTRYDAPPFISPHRDIAILKKLWDSGKNKYLTIHDMLDYEINICCQEKNLGGAVYGEYHRRGIVPVDNSPEEILEVVQEMNERIDGTIKYDDLDIDLQEKYREIVDNYPMRDNVLNNWRLGAKFLRENQWLLDV